MSLLKTIQQATGNDASYWKIVSTTINTIDKSVYVIIRGYKSKAVFDAGGAHMIHKKFSFDADFVQNLSPENNTFVPLTRNWLNEVESLSKIKIEDFIDATEDANDVF